MRSNTSDSITFTLPRSAIPDVLTLSTTLLDRMHELLERNTDDALSPVEREELDTLVQMAQFGQIVSMSLSPSPLYPGERDGVRGSSQ